MVREKRKCSKGKIWKRKRNRKRWKEMREEGTERESREEDGIMREGKGNGTCAYLFLSRWSSN